METVLLIMFGFLGGYGVSQEFGKLPPVTILYPQEQKCEWKLCEPMSKLERVK
jgi:hypothetical protein